MARGLLPARSPLSRVGRRGKPGSFLLHCALPCFLHLWLTASFLPPTPFQSRGEKKRRHDRKGKDILNGLILPWESFITLSQLSNISSSFFKHNFMASQRPHTWSSLNNNTFSSSLSLTVSAAPGNPEIHHLPFCIESDPHSSQACTPAPSPLWSTLCP